MSDDETDPFERLEDVGDRDGDPFEQLDDGDQTTDRDGDPLGDNADGAVEMDDPGRDTGSDDSFGADGRTGDPFEEVDVGELDPDEVWESIADAEKRGSVSQRPERATADVSKHRYCEQCEFFSDPPDVACSHDGTEILEFRDQETVRVVGCPVVAERERLRKHE